MDQLPIEIFEKILKLCSKHQLEICKKVNRRWYLTINQFKYEKLAITDSFIFKSRWFYDYDPIDYNDKIRIKCFKTFKFNLPDQFKRLKYLCLHSSQKLRNNKFKISNMINNMCELENLSLKGLFMLKNECINLKSLKTLDYNSSGSVLVMNTSNLENLRIGYCSVNLDIKYPKKIKYLYVTKMYSRYIEEFCNLEYFHVEHVYTAFFTILKELPMLKELHFDSSSTWATFEIVYEQQQELKRTEFKPFMFGINFESLDYSKCPNSVYDVDITNFTLFKEYYNNIADYLPLVQSFNYNDLEDIFDDDEFSSLNIIKKFVNVKELKITRNVKKTNQLIKILDRLSELIEKLDIQSSNLDQINFFNQLPKIIPILDSLKIEKEKTTLDFNFLLGFETIKKVELDQDLGIEVEDKFISKYDELLEFLMFKGIRTMTGKNMSTDICKIKRVKNKLTGKFQTLKVKQHQDNLPNDDDLHLDRLFDSIGSLEDLEIGGLFD